jgi:hypothetical protein
MGSLINDYGLADDWLRLWLDAALSLVNNRIELRENGEGPTQGANGNDEFACDHARV